MVAFARCSEPNDEVSSPAMLTGTWKSAEDDITITFSPDDRYTVRFGSLASFACRYQLTPEEQLLSLYDPPVTFECTYQLVNEDELILTRTNVPSLADTDQTVGIYHRLP